MSEAERSRRILEMEVLYAQLRELEEKARPIKERLEQLEIEFLVGTIER